MHVLYKYWKRLLVKTLLAKNNKKLLSILHRLRIKQIYLADFVFKKSFDETKSFKKQKFPQSPESIKKHSFEYDGCRSMITYI